MSTSLPLARTFCRSLVEWKAAGIPLGKAERQLMWQIGDWWLAGETFGYGVRKQIVTARGWRGPN